MLQRRRPDDPSHLLRLRHTDEWVGLLVLLALVIGLGAIFEAGVVRRFLRPDSELRIVLPQSGFGGLAAGGDVDVLGTHAGTIKRIVLNPAGEMYAVASIERQSEGFIRRDSTATIRLRYGVAGAAFVEIGRGNGDPMDWSYAVLSATVEPNPTDTLIATVNKIAAELVPVLERAGHAVAALDDVVTGVKSGQGTVGALLTDNGLLRTVEDTLGTLKGQIAQIGPMLEPVPGLLNQTHGVLGNVQSATRDLARATPQLTPLLRNATESTSNLPALLTQAQTAAAELSRLLVQLQGSWLLGGNGGAARPTPLRLPPREVRP